MTTTADRFTCSQCGKRVSKEAQHAHLRVRRPGGIGWDHSRCSTMVSTDIAAALVQRRAAAGLMA